MLCNWINSYHKNGNKVIDNTYQKRNPLAKYLNKKNLSDIEKLQYENMKLDLVML